MLTVMPGPANRGAGRPKRPTAWDYRHEDSKEGRFFVFDDRLQLSKDDKYHIENSIDHHVIDAGETPVTFAAAAGPSGDVYLTAIRKTSVKRDFVLIRKATRAEVDAMFGIVRRRRKSDTRRDIRRRLAEVERALDRSRLARHRSQSDAAGQCVAQGRHRSGPGVPRRFRPNDLAPPRSRGESAC